VDCAHSNELFQQRRHSEDDLAKLAAHLKECDSCNAPLVEAIGVIAHPNYQEASELVLARLRGMRYAEADIRVVYVGGEKCRGVVPGLPEVDSYLPVGSGIGDPYTTFIKESTLPEHDGTYSDDQGEWRVVHNRTDLSFPRSSTVVLVREREELSLVSNEEPPPFTQMISSYQALPVVLTQAELVYFEMSWTRAKRRGMDEVRGLKTLEEFVQQAVLSALDLNGISFGLRPLPSATAEQDLIPVPLAIKGDDLLAHLRRLCQQLLPHLSTEERTLLGDPRVFARTLCMEGLRNMLD